MERVQGGGVTTPAGFRAGAASAGIKEGPARLDLAVVVGDAPCAAHAVFTQSRVVAAPILISRERLAEGRAQGIVLNSGNANACTGKSGLASAREMADLAAAHVGVEAQLMLVASTGVIGVPLPMDRIRTALPFVCPSRDGGHDAARAILTTDLVVKECAVSLEIAGKRVIIGGMAKGSGMIHPNMATLLAVVTTDAALDGTLARAALQAAADRSFNQISVDRDTSTNDTLALFANGAVEGEPIRTATPEGTRFAAALERLCVELARMVARDGEGATRLIEVEVVGAETNGDARKIAREVACSNLVKAMVYGCDPNWGRILMAVGNAGAVVDPNALEVSIGEHQVAANGAAVSFDRSGVSAAMGADEVQIRVGLNRGIGRGTAWGCDLTEGYVKINAEYTT
ncbi:MAG: bifunctional glutamate N-acetyltransferase/amino-acid acetyltransferase ArgJ [Chloroflexi bacterium]|nr:bifunctional glutamate N-acetyltransferase/amino-acid acetyltransferase ArgJ [Chloroflexota bacterium]